MVPFPPFFAGPLVHSFSVPASLCLRVRPTPALRAFTSHPATTFSRLMFALTISLTVFTDGFH
jgi:hypothetical protein